MKKKLNNKGIAIEMTLFTLLEIFGLCMLLTTVCLQMAKAQKEELTEVSEYLAVAQIVSDFQKNPVEYEYTGQDYEVTKSTQDEGQTYVMVLWKNGVVAYIEATKQTDGTYKITKHLNDFPVTVRTTDSTEESTSQEPEPSQEPGTN